MDTMINFSNDKLCTFMTKDEMRKKAPYVFATAPTNPSVSEKYVFASTETIIDDMEKLGWGVVDCKQQRANKRSNVRSFHIVAFQNKDIFITKENENGEETIECFPRIIIENSHDGRNSFKFMVGFFRLVCSNGLVVATEQFENISVRHINYSFEELRKVVASAIQSVAENVTVMNEMQERELSQAEKYQFAEKALRIRNGLDDNEKMDVTQEDLDDILTPERKEDEGNSLWAVFNVLQEKMIKGNYQMKSPTNGRLRKARAIKGIAKDIEINQGLFMAASTYRAVA